MLSLTRTDARLRAESTDLHRMNVTVDLTNAASLEHSHYPVTSVFFLTVATQTTFIDIVGDVVEVFVEGSPHPFTHTDSRLTLNDLPAGHPIEITVNARCAYSRTGEGLHRYVDPEDGRTYLYTQFEPADAQRAWPCMDQPDLKARWTFTVTAPSGWVVTSTSAIDRVDDHGPTQTTFFAPTPPLSSYITAVVVGQWAVVDGGAWEPTPDVTAGISAADETHTELPAARSIPLRLLCRQALAPYLDADDILTVTRQGMDLFHRLYSVAYPWGPYDQIFVPEFNLGGMENPGCVTLSESFLSRDTPTFAERQQRANVVLHELCHMWFGDLTTPQWWDDLWLKESFADHQGTFAAATATQYTGEWAHFALVRKAWAYIQDQYPTTHPIAADVPDVEAARTNFDGITYAKGAAVLKQLVAWVGQEAFEEGASAYFRAHAFGSATLRDLLGALAASSGRDLEQWERAWIHTTGPSVLSADIETTPSGAVTRFDLLQSAPEGAPLILRPHRLIVSTWSLVDGALSPTRRFTVRTDSARVPIDEGGAGEPLSSSDLDLVVINDDDLTYAVTRLDSRSTRTALDHLGSCPDPLTRAVVWGSLWNAVRDGLLPGSDFVHAVLAHAPRESEDSVVTYLLTLANTAVTSYTAGPKRPPLRRALIDRAMEAIESAPTLDRARAWADALLDAFTGWVDHDAGDLARVRQIASGSAPGLSVGPALSWHARIALASNGQVALSDLDQWLANSDTGEARTFYARAIAAIPDGESRRAAWAKIQGHDLSNEHLSATLEGLSESSWVGSELIGEFFESVAPFWDTHSMGMGQRFVARAYPHHLDVTIPARSVSVLHAGAKWLEDHVDAAPALRRAMIEHLDANSRSLRAQSLAPTPWDAS